MAASEGIRSGDDGPGAREVCQGGQLRSLLALIDRRVRLVLGLLAPEEFDPQQTFKDIGFGSLTSLRMREQLVQDTGLPLDATLLFDHPTPAALAAYLRAQLTGAGTEETVPGPAATDPPSLGGAAQDDPIAIVSFSCRYPGGADSPEALWQLIERGGDAISGFPTGRGWDLPELYGSAPGRPARSHTREGGFLHDADLFDAEFFRISPREALTMDPQQRLVLETSWEAVERAGIDPLSLRGSRTGVFLGCAHSDYGPGLDAVSEELAAHLVTGSATSVLSGRVAYTLGLEGPAMTVDTACSSSLVALHLAARALRAGECGAALAGGVTVMSTAGWFVGMSRQGALAKDGRSKAFSADADGMGMSEGVGVVLLERLSDARRQGHPVLALLRSSAVNQDGASSGLTVPRSAAQRQVITDALAGAGLAPGEVDAVEAHGTGTALGDPIEVRALQAVYGQDRPEGSPLWLGSVKSNIGHTAAAAGVAGVIKMVLAMRHGVLPRTVHAERRSTRIKWSAGQVELLTEARPWPAADRPRRAGVSSFGISGTNAHVIVEQAAADCAAGYWDGTDRPAAEAGTGGGADGDAVLWVVSGRDPAALRAQATRLGEHLRARPQLRPAEVAYSLATTRSAFEQRAALVGRDRGDLLRGLAALAAGESAEGLVEGKAPKSRSTVFVFPGQGAQWAGMAQRLLDSSAVFARRLGECGQALAPYLDWSLDDVLRERPGAPSLERVDVVQPVLFAVMVSLAELWRSVGVVPDAVVGHSQGEIAAACVAGALSLPDAARVVALRSQVLADAAGSGGMASVARSAHLVRQDLRGWEGRLSLGAVNAPSAVVVSGDQASLEAYLAQCAERGVQARRVAVDYASHSARMEPLRERLLEVLAGISPRSCETAFYSSVTGGALDTSVLDGDYWYRNLRATVDFEQATRAVLAAGHSLFVEVSPHPVLAMGIEESAEAAGSRAAVVGTLRRGDGGPDRFLASLGAAHVHGAAVDWEALFATGGERDRARRVPLPSYAFQRQSYWLDSGRAAAAAPAAGAARGIHPLLGTVTGLAHTGEVLLAGEVSARTHPWLAEHQVRGEAVAPGSLFVELALTAAARSGCGAVDELVLHAPLPVPADAAVQLQVAVGAPEGSGARPLEVYCRRADADAGQPWTRHATGTLAPAAPTAAPAASPAPWPPPGAVAAEPGAVGALLAAAGIGYGPAFQGLRALWQLGEEVFAEVALDPGLHEQARQFALHPALLDAALQPMALASAADGAAAEPLARPFAWHGVTVDTPGATAVRVTLRRTGGDRVEVALADDAGRPLARIDSLVLRAADGGTEPLTVPAVPLSPAARPAPPKDAGTAPGGWSERLAGQSESEQLRLLRELVCAQTASVLGHPAGHRVPADQAFRDIGFNSVMAVELCNRLNSATGVRLPAVSVFDHPTPEALAARLRAKALPDTAGGPAALLHARLDEVETVLNAADGDTLATATARLQALLWKFSDLAHGRPAGQGPHHGAPDGAWQDPAAATDEEMFALIDAEFGAG